MDKSSSSSAEASTPAPTYSVSGEIEIEAGMAVDGTVKNPDAPSIDNNTLDKAQRLFNPVMLGGHVAADAQDITSSDFYDITLAAGQSARLTISNFSNDNPAAVDLDLFLYDVDDILVDFSDAIDQAVEQVTAPSDGLYKLEVRAISGNSNYLLTVGQAASTALTQTQAENTESTQHKGFVPGDVVVRFKDTPADAAIQTKSAYKAKHSKSLGMRAKGGGHGRAMLMHFDNQSERDTVFGTLNIQPSARERSARWQKLPKSTRQRLETLQVIKALRQRDDVLYAEPNYIVHSQLAPNDSLLQLQWHYRLINTEDAWSQTTGSSDVIVAVVDSGVFMAHPDLKDNLTETGFNFAADPINNDPDDPGDGTTGDGTTSDSSLFHGTHVAGTIAASTNNAEGVAGVGWNTRIMPIRVIGKGGTGTSYDVMQGVRYAAGLSNDSGIILDKPADIINISLGGIGSSRKDQDVYRQVRDKGIIVVAAAGNNGNNTLIYPAAYDGVISVGAVTPTKDRAPYSNTGSTLDLVAPGGDMRHDLTGDGFQDGVYSTHADDSSGSRIATYSHLQGTSMASPHVAGVIALMKAVDPNLTYNSFMQKLQAGELTEPLGEDAIAGERNNTFGYGLIDAFMAVQAAAESADSGVLPEISASPNILDFGPFLFDNHPDQESQSFELSVIGTETLTVSSVTVQADWVDVEAIDVDDNGIGTYEVILTNTSKLPGTYSTKIRIETNQGQSTTVMITLQILAPNTADTAPDVGVHYVQLLDANSLETIAEQLVSVENGRYTFSFPNVRQGEYFLVAGTDNNNDWLICDAGEACGSYPTLNQPSRIIVSNSNQSGLNFTTGYRAGPELRNLNDELPEAPFRRMSNTTMQRLAQ